MRGSLGEESGLLPVGLQGETERRVYSKLFRGEAASKERLSSGDRPVLLVIVQFLTDEGLSGKAKLLQRQTHLYHDF